jgi:hypothetical protein
MTPTAVRPGLPPMPPAIAELPVDARGYPVPWFVAWIDGRPDFRVIGEDKTALAHNQKLCWICGRHLGSYLAFVVGPMCAVNRISAEPPSHRRCAEFAAQACPFLVLPKAQRRNANLPTTARDPAGHMIRRNPGVALVWVTKSYRVVRAPRPDGSPGVLFEMGDPREVLCFAEGRKASVDEIRASVENGVPLLAQAIPEKDVFAHRRLEAQVRDALKVLGVPA